jgi:hypothetical protein
MRVLTQQPPYRTNIDWSNPLAKRLQLAQTSSSGLIDLVKQRPATKSTSDEIRGVNISRLGSALSFKGARATDGGINFGQVQAVKTDAITVLVLANPNTTQAQTIFSQRLGSSPFNQFSFGVNSNTSLLLDSGRISVACLNVSGGARASYSVANTFTDNGWHVYVTTFAGAPNYPVLYYDGESVVVTNQGTGTGTWVSSTQHTRIGNVADYTADATYAASCDIPLCLVWDRVLSADEVRRISANPWQIFKQNTVRDRLLTTLLADFEDVDLQTIEPPITAGYGSSRQLGGLPTVNRNNSLGRNSTFLWSAANPTYDATGNFLATGIHATTFIGSGGLITSQPPNITHTSEGSIYTSSPTPIGTGTGGGIVFAPYGVPGGIKTDTSWTVAILARYVASTQNLRVFGISNAAQNTWHLYGVSTGGNPWVRTSSSYTQNPGQVATATTPYTLNKVHLTVWTFSTTGASIYVDGKLVAVTTNNHTDLMAAARIAITTQGIQPMLVSTFNRTLNRQEVRSLTANPWQLFKQNGVRQRLLHTFIPDFTAELAPPSQLRSTYLTTASSSDKNNAITSQLLFASSPAHGNTDGANAKIAWSTSSDIKVVPGRGGLAWVYGRAQSSLPVADSFNKPLNSTRWTMLSVLSLELDHVSQITPGHYFSGPNWGGNVGAGTKLQINSNGKILLTTTGGSSIVADSVTITPRKVMVVAVTSDGTNTKFYLNGKLVHTSTTVFDSGGSVTYQPRRISDTDSVAGTGLRPWYVYLSAMWTRPLQEHEIAKLSQDPYQLFKRPESANQKLMHSLRYSETMPTEYYYYRHKPNYFVKPQNIGIIDYSNPVTRGLLVSWPMITAGNQVLDASNNRRHSNTMVTTDVSWTHGINGRQLTFTGSQTSGAVSWGDVPWLDGLTTITVEIDFVITNISNSAKLFAKWGGSFSILISVGSSGQISFIPHVGGSMRFWYSANGTISANTRYHLVIVWNGGNSASFFLNGVRGTFTTVPSSFSGGLNATTNNLQLGVADDGTPLTGSIGMVNVWNRPLTDSEALDRYSKRWNIFQSGSRSLQGYIVERVIPYNEKPTYVNYTDLPKTYVPVNKDHPLARRMVLCTTPAHGFRDAYDQDLIWVNPTSSASTYYNQTYFDEYVFGTYKKYGKAWGAMAPWSNKRTTNLSPGKFGINFNSAGLTATAFIYIDQDTYPLINRFGGAIGSGAGRTLIHGGYTSQWTFDLTGDGRLAYGIPGVGFNISYPRGGSNTIIPLKQLVAVSVVVIPNQEVRFFVDGKFIGSARGAWGGNALVSGPYIGFNFINGDVGHFNLQFYLAALWRRALTDNEIAEFSQHPGQIFQKQHLPREKLLERNFFTDLLPTYPSLPGITKLNRDDRGLYVPKFKVHHSANTSSPTLAQWWYPPTSGGGIYVSVYDKVLQQGLYGVYPTARPSPYGPGLVSGGWEPNRPINLDILYAQASVTVVSLFYLQNAKRLTTNGRVFALVARSSNPGQVSFTQSSNDIGWTNWTGERRVLFGPMYSGGSVQITGVADGLHCAVMHINRATQQVTCYFDGKLVGTAVGSSNPLPYAPNIDANFFFGSISNNQIGAPLFAGQLIDQPFNSQQLSVLSKDPLLYFFKDSYQLKTDLLTKKLKYVETDDNGIWTPYNRQSTYVNTVALPKTYIPVNKNHPLTKTMLYCTTPAHGSRDAYNQEMIWSTRMELANNYTDWNSPYWHGVAARGGRAWQNKGYASRSTAYFKPPLILTSTVYTMLQFLSIETDSYPLAGEIPLMGHGYASANHLRIDKWGQLSLSYPYNGPSEIARVSGSRRVPLRRVVCVAATRTPSGTTLYIDGQKLGTVPQAPRWEVGGAADQWVHALGTTGGGDNASISTHHVYMSAMWHRALSDQEIASLSQNPGQIFLHYERFKRIYPEATPEQFFNKFFLFFG